LPIKKGKKGLSEKGRGGQRGNKKKRARGCLWYTSQTKKRDAVRRKGKKKVRPWKHRSKESYGNAERKAKRVT